MLVLSRRAGQSIMIGKDIKVTVTKLANGQVWLGIDAPKSIVVDREEIAIKRANDFK